MPFWKIQYLTLSQIMPYTLEVPIKTIPRFDDIFNDTSLHCFRLENLVQAPFTFWNRPEPKYSTENLEIIINTKNKTVETLN